MLAATSPLEVIAASIDLSRRRPRFLTQTDHFIPPPVTRLPITGNSTDFSVELFFI